MRVAHGTGAFGAFLHRNFVAFRRVVRGEDGDLNTHGAGDMIATLPIVWIRNAMRTTIEEIGAECERYHPAIRRPRN